MARIGVRNLPDIHRRDPLLGQALQDLLNHVSTLKQENEDLKSKLAVVQAKQK